ncbi:RNA polymerase sigma factor [Brevibacillus sp. 7WMA2]|uniref:RNA polymerase sigma-W factor n=3 Tax=Brevibacillus TaxID=55080 RepID=A0A075R9Y5_BRELA|nr:MULTISPECIES: RNA polymerase sigma factor [Brevibacillus]HAS02129.1 RNA polymerase sigma factor [Brevibacillus sp.]AIG28073.1 RNA polymerase sigma-W factor [Brevibacillus laterosporus LMG 15441]AKF93503.1 RNA polymerase [Brevibacillus laterosporus]AUM66462.1 RNA polymerase sigma factor [Brevibacillus laterosporus]AYK05337.1 RNA polymerase sigma factor [Brevibacillus laterosporus]
MQADSEIVQQVLQGDVEAFRDIIQKYQHMIYIFIYKMVNNKADAEDLTQEVFIKAYEKLNTYRGESQLSTWLHTLARNRTIDFLRRRKFHDTDEQLAFVPSGVQNELPQESLLRKEQQKTIAEAFEQLSDSYKEVIVLRCTHEYPFDKIASLLGVAESTARVRYLRARQEFAKVLTKMEGGLVHELPGI